MKIISLIIDCGLLKIPVGEYKKLPITIDNTKEEICDYLNKSKDMWDKAVRGHSKNQIIQLLTNEKSNPSLEKCYWYGDQ